MAHDINIVSIVGRLTRDAELKYLNSGTAVCKFSLAVNRRRKSGDEWVEEVSYFDIVLWGKRGEGVNQYLQKGKQIAVSGELRQNRWEQDGQNRSKVEIVASNVELLSGGGNKDGGNSGNQGHSQNLGNQNRNNQQQSFKNPGSEDFEDDIPF